MAERHWYTADFDYVLPHELIAQQPASERGSSRLLVLDPKYPIDHPGARRHLSFTDLPTLMNPGDLVVVNSTRVRHARLLGTRPSGAAAEVLLLHPTGAHNWLAMGKPGKALQPGKRIVLGNGFEIETMSVQDDGLREIRFIGCTAEQAISQFGKLPLPPYITRTPQAKDEERYQTIYAQREGSVAAPTAGLHFTDDLMSKIIALGIGIEHLDLEVGPGTFKPVEEEDPALHPMHAERFFIPEGTARAVLATKQGEGKIWAIGTTVVRALESACREDGSMAVGPAETSLMITPGYRFRVVDGLVTNFHLPRSTLLMLVAAFAGFDNMMAGYRSAVEERYRFYSYGDAMCIPTRAP